MLQFTLRCIHVSVSAIIASARVFKHSTVAVAPAPLGAYNSCVSVAPRGFTDFRLFGEDLVTLLEQFISKINRSFDPLDTKTCLLAIQAQISKKRMH